VKSRDAHRAHHHASVGRTDYAWECLSRLARILVCCGHSPGDLVSALREICRTLKVPRRRWDPTLLDFLSDLPHVVALWYSDPRYLDSTGQPATLPLRGHGPSLAELAERVLPGEDPGVVVRSLVRNGGVQRRGSRYVPTGRHLPLRVDSGRIHSANALLRMLRTVERNLSAAPNSSIFERAAINPNFPVAALGAFHRNVKAYASRFLTNVDTNMARHEKRTTGGPRTRVGIEVFAFEEPLVEYGPARKRPHGSRSAGRSASSRRSPRRRKS
jgi:Family of unknown function (DUF6502)